MGSETSSPPPTASLSRKRFRDTEDEIMAPASNGLPIGDQPLPLPVNLIDSPARHIDVASGGNLPFTTHPQALSPSKTPAFLDEATDVGGGKKRKMAEALQPNGTNDQNEIIGNFMVCQYCDTKIHLDSEKIHWDHTIDGHMEVCELNPDNAGFSPPLKQPSMNNVLTTHIFSGQKKLEKKLAAFIVIDEMPFSVVEGEGFVQMMNGLQPLFKIPSRKEIASLVWDLYTTKAAKIKSIIGDRRVSISIDTRTSIRSINYIKITAHFLDNDWKLHKRIINFTDINSHEEDDIGKVLETCLSNWEIKKVFTITVDNANTNDKTVEYMGKKLKDMDTLLFDGKYLHLRCCSHIINLIVRSGLKFLNQTVESIRNCVKYIHSADTRLDQFRECAILLNMDEMSIVPLDVPGRWNSTYTMLSVAYTFKKVFDKMTDNVQFVEYFEEVEGSEMKKRVGPPNENDWEKVEVFVNFLKRFYDTTLLLGARKTTTSTLIWEEIITMRTTIANTLHEAMNPVLKEFATKIESKFNKYWGDLEKLNKLTFLAHILDPRYKLQMIEIHLVDLKFDGARIQSFVDGLKNCLLELYHAYNRIYSLESFNGVDDGDVEKEMMENSYKNNPVKLKYLLKLVELRKAQNQSDITNEVDKYFSDPFVKRNPKFDILEWWKMNTTIFPVVSMIAKDILAIPSASVANENAFSLGRRVVDPFKAALPPKMVEALVCAGDWLRGEEINLYKESTEEALNFYKDCEEVVTCTPRRTSSCGESSASSSSGSS